MKFKFGVQEKTALLVLALVPPTAYFTATKLFDDTKEIVTDHEIVDLADEASLRAWEISDQIEILKYVTRRMSEDFEFLAEFPALAMETQKLRWENYLCIDVITGNDVPNRRSIFSRREGVNLKGADAMIESLMKGEPDRIQLTPIKRMDISGFRGTEGPHFAPVVCAGFRMKGTGGFLAITMTLDRQGSSRHLMMLVDENDRFLLQPNIASKDQFDHRETFVEAIANQREEANKDNAREDDQLSTVQRLEPLYWMTLAPPYHIIEGRPGRAVIDTIHMDVAGRSAFFKRIAEHLALSESAFGGMTAPVNEVRILAKSRAQMERDMKFVEKAFAEKFPGKFDGIDWKNEVECANCDLYFVRISLNTVEGIKQYLLLFSGFREELVSNIVREMKTLRTKVFGWTLGSGIIAFVAALFFVRPLRKITITAQSVADTRHEDLREKIETMTKSLPVSRQDEVGEIARALKRLFNEVQASHRELDNRVRDRTRELEDANEKLQGLAREKDSFLANVSHELRNPLNVVDGYLQFLETSDLDDEQRDDVRKSRRAAKALLELINDILDYQKITMRGITLEPADVELEDFLEEIKDTMEIHAAKNNNRIVMDHGDGLGVIETDAKRLRQVIVNLMGNSSKFTKDGTVTLETRRKSENGGEWIEFRVKDTGRGMTEEEQSKIFTVFYTNKKANESGTGLGLAISRELCRMMNGHVGLESSVLGEGTTFLIRIPCRQGEGVVTTPEAVPGLPPGSHRILVIDDDPDVREIMRRHLEKQGYEVTCAASGSEGIALARDTQPDAITLDAVMPEIDGWEVLSTLKSDPATSSIPVLMVTILNKEAKGFALGADDYLVKPVDWIRFSQVLGNLTSLGKHNTILVIDDEEETRALFRRVLTKDGWRVVEAEHGAEALNILAATRPDLIILDLMMPVMDGFEFLSEFRRHARWEHIPVIVVTAKTLTDEERRTLGLSVSRVLEKGSISHEELLAIIHRRVGPGSSGIPQSQPSN